MQLTQALADVRELRSALARSGKLRLLRAGTVAATGVLGVAGAAAQRWVISAEPTLPAFALYWSLLAACSAGVAITGVWWRYRCEPSTADLRVWGEAAKQFLPAMLCGGILTAAILWRAPEAGRLLPGVWSVTFALGVWSAAHLFPSRMRWVAAYYLALGSFLLYVDWGLQSLGMLLAFGVGQLGMALAVRDGE